jgi:glycosyltransferase involved in cell wall biosynthesis
MAVLSAIVEEPPAARPAERVPAVSVVVPCYNGGRFIDQLLQTLAEQTFRDFELIIVDDGSDEETRAKLATLDPSILVIHQTNQGPGAARNSGFRRAKADLVLALDCDDRLEPEYLAQTVKAMRAGGPDAGIVFTHERMSGLREGCQTRYFKRFDQLFINRMPSCILVRKAAWEAVGGYDESMREGYEDWEFTVAVEARGYGCIEIPEPLFIYRVSNEGLLMSRSSRMHAELWRRMRAKYPNLYRLPALLRLWWDTRSIRGELSLLRAMNLLAFATILPDRWFSALVHGVRSRKAKA